MIKRGEGAAPTTIADLIDIAEGEREWITDKLKLYYQLPFGPER